MEGSTGSIGPIKVGVITDQTGPLSFMGIANANVAKMVIDDINASGGLLGRKVNLYLEDSATTDSVAEARSAKLVQQDHVDVIFGGIYSSTRQAIKVPAVVDGKKLYIYPEQYEGQECDPLIFCTGPVPAQQVEPLIPWLMQQTGAKSFYLPSADYIWPHTLVFPNVDAYFAAVPKHYQAGCLRPVSTAGTQTTPLRPTSSASS